MKKKKYSIQISYKTGDSFSSRDDVDTLDLTWNKLEVAKENLKRIKEHYLWYEEINNSYKSRNRNQNPKEPEWHKEIKIDHGDNNAIISLKTDDGKDFQFYAFWCGYFETLYSAEIVFSDNDLRVDFR